jgi:hypothetical protein
MVRGRHRLGLGAALLGVLAAAPASPAQIVATAPQRQLTATPVHGERPATAYSVRSGRHVLA